MNKYQFNQIQLDEFFDAFVWLYVILQDIWISHWPSFDYMWNRLIQDRRMICTKRKDEESQAFFTKHIWIPANLLKKHQRL